MRNLSKKSADDDLKTWMHFMEHQSCVWTVRFLFVGFITNAAVLMSNHSMNKHKNSLMMHMCPGYALTQSCMFESINTPLSEGCRCVLLHLEAIKDKNALSADNVTCSHKGGLLSS